LKTTFETLLTTFPHFLQFERLNKAKRKRDDDVDDEFDVDPKKMSHGVPDEVPEDLDLDLLAGELDEEAIAKLVDSAPEAEKIDSAGVKRLVVNFEKAYTENTQLREKFADSPEKFIDSELKLDRCLKDMQAIATAPEHYIELLRNGTHDSILSLLSHDNTDIVIGAIDLLRDFLAGDDDEDADNANELGEEEDKLVHHELVTQTIHVFTSQLLKLDLLSLLVSCLSKFDENIAEEKQGVYNTLELFENLFEIAIDESCSLILEKTKFVKFLLERVASDKFGAFDDVKLYASEILCIMAQSSPDIQRQIGKDNGIDSLLQTLAKYRKEEPKVAEEEEMLENICNTLCVTATNSDNRALFLKSEGLELLKLLIKSGKYCKRGAAKILNFYLTHDITASTRWLEIGGLGTLFTAFMQQSKIGIQNGKKKKKKHSQFEDEEHVVSTLAALLTNFKDAVQAAQARLPSDDLNNASEVSDSSESAAELEKYGSFIERIVVKFAENNCEKLDRLIKLHVKYFDRMRKIDTDLMEEDDEDKGRDEDDEEQIYQDRLEAGLFTLQLIDYLLVFVSNSLPVLKQRATKYLKEQNGDWNDVKSVLLEYAVRAAAENDEDPENATGETAYIRGLADSIQV
jgi:beta-catenin-like protein 1